MRTMMLLAKGVVLMFFCFIYTVDGNQCTRSDHIRCSSRDKCIPLRYICDYDDDCGDRSDENSLLCQKWSSGGCDRNYAKCKRGSSSSCINMQEYCTNTHNPCEGTVDPRVCQMIRDQKLKRLSNIVLTTTTTTTTPAPTEEVVTEPPLEVSEEDLRREYQARVDVTISHSDCRNMYTRVGDQCLSLFSMASMSWLEASVFCHAIGGDLFTVKDENYTDFANLLQHLHKYQVTSDFWVGGRYLDSLGWHWVDNTPMTLGAPFWALRYQSECVPRPTNMTRLTRDPDDEGCYNYVQTPPLSSSSFFLTPQSRCSALSYQHYHYIINQDCEEMKSPLCLMSGEDDDNLAL